MLIQGMVTDVKPPHSTDKWNNQYQYVTVNTQAGPIIGIKASKQQLTQNFIGQNVEWDCITETNQGQTYNKFKRPPQQQTGTPQGQQAPQQPAQRAQGGQPDWDAIAEGKIRHGVVCAAIQSLQIECKGIQEANYWTEYIMTGIAPLPPGQGNQIEPGEEGWQH